MKTYCKKLGVLLISTLIINSLLLSQTWTERAPIPTPRWNPAIVAFEGKIFVIGGQGGSYPYPALSTFEVYDPSIDEWQVLDTMPTARWGLMAAVAGDEIFVIGGQTGSFAGGYISTGVVEVYNTATGTWTEKTAMPTARGWGSCSFINDTIFVFGGYSSLNKGNHKEVEKYCLDTDTWSSDPDMPNYRYNHVNAVVNNSIYLIGGWILGNYVEEYDLETKTWYTKASMPTSRGGSGCDTLDGKIYVIGGRGGDSDEFEVYDPATDIWDTLPPLPTPREGLVAAFVDGEFFTITGSAPISQGGLPYYDKNEVYTEFVTGIKETGNTNGSLFQNYPNPSKSRTSIKYSINKGQEGIVKLYLSDLRGQKIKEIVNKYHTPGLYKVSLNTNNLSPGVYFYVLEAGDNFSISKKLVITK